MPASESYSGFSSPSGGGTSLHNLKISFPIHFRTDFANIRLTHLYADDFPESQPGTLGIQHMLTMVFFLAAHIAWFFVFFPGVPDPGVLVFCFLLASTANFPFSNEDMSGSCIYG